MLRWMASMNMDGTDPRVTVVEITNMAIPNDSDDETHTLLFVGGSSISGEVGEVEHVEHEGHDFICAVGLSPAHALKVAADHLVSREIDLFKNRLMANEVA